MTGSMRFCVAMVAVLAAAPAYAQSSVTPIPATPNAIVCESKGGAREHCNVNTSAGIALVKSVGTGACVLGKSWGYDDSGVWVSDNCGGEFMAGQTAPAAPSTAAVPPEYTPIETWGEFDPGKGFLIGRSSAGQLEISGYGLVRYMNQMPAEQSFTDHLGNERVSDGRHDIYPHRVMIFLKGWVGKPQLIYVVTFWTVLDTNQNAIFFNVGYQFNRKFSVYAGLNGNPGTRSLQGSHPLWLGQDRVMADEFFRPYFGAGVWVQGEPVKGLWYNVMLSDLNSILGVRATQLDRRWTTGASMWWMPTTQEFGPRGAYGDWEYHDKLATRVGFSSVHSPEQRFTNASNGSDNTTLRLADSVNVFDTGALAPGVTVETTDYRVLSFDAGMKYRGVFVQTEVYNRWLDNFKANAPLPVASVHDKGFYVQAAFYPIKKKLELYGATSQVYGDKAAGFDTSNDVLGGFNFYPTDTRYHRLNVQWIHVNRSPVSSVFGYYVGGQTGNTMSVGFSVFF